MKILLFSILTIHPVPDFYPEFQQNIEIYDMGWEKDSKQFLYDVKMVTDVGILEYDVMMINQDLGIKKIYSVYEIFGIPYLK